MITTPEPWRLPRALETLPSGKRLRDGAEEISNSLDNLGKAAWYVLQPASANERPPLGLPAGVIGKGAGQGHGRGGNHCAPGGEGLGQGLGHGCPVEIVLP